MPEPTVIPRAMKPSGNGDFVVYLHHRSTPGAVVALYVMSCDLDVDEGTFGVMASPQWVRCENIDRIWDTCTWDTSADDGETGDRFVLPGSYHDIPAADRAARQVAEALMSGDTTALTPFGDSMLAQIFRWDGQPFDPS